MTPPKLNTQSNTQISLLNQSRIYEAFGENEKLTINEVVERVNENREPHEVLSNRTIRRAIEGLVNNGFIKPFGKANKAITYGRIGATYATADDKLIKLGGELMSIEDFMRTIVEPTEKPLQKGKMPVVSEEMEHQIRRRLAFVVLTAGNVGMSDQLQKVSRELHNVLSAVDFVQNILQSFLNSPVWYEQYRDQMAYGVRNLQEKDPDLYQLAYDYVRSS